MLTLRLRRIGKKRHATFRFIVSEKTRSPQSRAVEFLGSYDPHTNPPTIKLHRERVKHWLDHGAQPSETVHNILIEAGLLEGQKVRVARPKKRPAAEKQVAPVETAESGSTGTAPAAEASPALPESTEAVKSGSAPAEAGQKAAA